MLDASTKEDLISGFVHVPGEMRHVRVHSELLILSVASWLGEKVEVRMRTADEATDAGASIETVAPFVDEAATLNRVLIEGWLAAPASVGTDVARRTSIPEWRVENQEEAEAYGRRLVQQNVGGAEGVEWVFGFGEDGMWTLLLPPRLYSLLAHVGPYVEGGVATRQDLTGFVELLEEARVG